MREISLKLSRTASLAFLTCFSAGQNLLKSLSKSRVACGLALLWDGKIERLVLWLEEKSSWKLSWLRVFKIYLQLILCDRARVSKDRWAMDALHRVSASLHGLIVESSVLTRIMNSFFHHRCLCLGWVDWNKAIGCEISMARSHNIFGLDWSRQSRLCKIVEAFLTWRFSSNMHAPGPLFQIRFASLAILSLHQLCSAWKRLLFLG